MLQNMEVCCSLKSIVGGLCGADTRNREQDEVLVVPSLSCVKDITTHTASYSFSGPENEVDLILCRAAIFTKPDNITSMSICPLHRAKLGVRWDGRGERAPDAEYHPFCLTMERQKKVGQKEIGGSESYNRSYCYVTLVSFYKLDR